MAKTLSQLDARALAYAQMRGLRTLRLGELRGPLHLSARQEIELLSRMSRSGMIARVRRGLYLVPSRLPLGGKWGPDEMLALSTLIRDRQGTYQICGPNAFNRYGFDEQVPARVYAYNNRISGDRQVGSACFTLIKVADERLGDTETFTTEDGLPAVYSSRVRTLMDAVYDWSRFDSLPRAYEWIRRDLRAGRLNASDLIRTTLRFGNQGTIRRIGALLEREGVSAQRLTRLRSALSPTTSLIPWVPTLLKRGESDPRWGVVINEQ